jgi:hypothetical protein
VRKSIFLGASLLLLVAASAGFEASLVTSNGSSPDLEFDRQENVSVFYSSFPSSFTQPKAVGSFSFRDQSIVNPNLYLNVSGNSSEIAGREVQLYYSSFSKNETEPLLVQPLEVPEFTGDYILMNVDMSAFKAVYPGIPYAGLVERTYNVTSNNSTRTVTEKSVNLTRLNTTMDGNFSILPSIQSVEGTTRLAVDEMVDGDDERIHVGRSMDQGMIVSVTRGGKVLDETRTRFGEERTFNFTFSGGEKVYVNGILALKTKSVGRCQSISDNDFYYLLNESQFNVNETNSSCMTVEDVNNTIIDFANRTIDGDNNLSMENERCAISLRNTSEVTVKNPRVQQYSRGICLVESSDATISGTASRGNTMGIYLNDSSADIRRISLKNNGSEIEAVSNSMANMTDVNFATANITGTGYDVRMENVFEPPPDPENLRNISQWVKVNGTDSSANLSLIGFNYASISQLGINPKYVYKVNQAGNRSWDFQKLSAVVKPVDSLIYTSENVSSFSVFAAYGENVTGEAGDGPAEGTGTQGEGDSAGGGLTPQPEPEPQPDPTPINLNLSLEEDFIRMQQGSTEELNFTLTNWGSVDAPNVYVEANVDPGWQSGRQDFLNIPQGQRVRGGILLSVYQSEITGNYTIPVEAKSQNGATFDTEMLTVEVIPRQMIRDLRVVEGPTFLRLEGDSESSVGFLIENSGDFNLENVTATVRNAPDCVESVSGSHSFEVGERKNVEYSIHTAGQEQTCTGVVAFSAGEEKTETLGFTPVRIQVEEPSIIQKLATNVLPVLTLIWTLFTLYWVRKKFYE